jgi:PAT family beta-lactamase induction signal transducer AmpG
MPTPAVPAPAQRPGALRSIGKALSSWRTASVSLLSFASGLPLGLVWIAMPDWLRKEGVDIRVIGLVTLAQAPWTFKFLWSPFMDRYVPPFWGRRRGWMAIAQVALFAGTLALAGVGDHPDTPWVIGALALAIAFAGATHDIAIDAYAVDVLQPEEQAVAVGARNAVYRGAMFVAGGLAITLAGAWSWPAVNIGLACLFLPMLLVTRKAPEPAAPAAAPKTLREAAWYPFVGFLSRHRALEILSFVLLYKLADNLAQTLQRPFLVDLGYTDFDRGVALATIGLLAALVGTFVGGLLTEVVGLGRALWLFGFLQLFSNVGYILLAHQGGVNRPLMYGAIGFELAASGLGSGAFGVLLLRITQRRFSATQYALFSSLFGLPRLVAGPICGFLQYAVGWETFFWLTLPFGIPGLVMLARFVPWGVKDPIFTVEPPREQAPLTTAGLVGRGLLGGTIAASFGLLVSALLSALRTLKDQPEAPFDLAGPLAALFRPTDLGGWVGLFGLVAFGFVCGLMTAAVAAARRGAGRDLAQDTSAGIEGGIEPE